MTEQLDDDTLVRDIVRTRLGAPVTEMVELAGGTFSRAYAVTVDGEEYVVRISAYEHSEESFAKDAYAGQHFASAVLPIPQVVALGRVAGEHYAISERSAGSRLSLFPRATQQELMPQALDVFDAIARVDVSGTTGYGDWDATGNGRLAGWREFLVRVADNHTEGFYADWHRLFGGPMLEREVVEAVYGRMLDLLSFVPEERTLIHLDYHFDNVVSDGRNITGVIDWGNACYGDPLFDVAWLKVWFIKEGFPEAAAKLCRRRENTPHFRERMIAYECWLGIDDLRFYATIGRREGYESTRDRLLALVANGRV